MTTGASEITTQRPLRRDAARNRELILETAAEVFAELGIDASYDEIARRACVGVGTVYRRFPERSELVRALFESRIEEIVAIAGEAADMADPLDALAWFMEKAIERQAADRGLKEVMTGSGAHDESRAIGRELLGPVLGQLVERARADGALRADIEVTDFGVQLMVMSSMSTAAQPDLWRRYLALFLDGLRARPDLQPLPVVAPANDEMHDLICSLEGR